MRIPLLASYASLVTIVLSLLPGSAPGLEATEGFVPGAVQIKFEYGAIRELSERLLSDDVLSTPTRDLLEQVGFVEGRRIFPRSMMGDTIVVSSTGELIRKIDVSHWYVLEVSHTTNIPELISDLESQPEVIAAVPARMFRPMDVFPNDPSFQAGHQWGFHQFADPGKDIHAPGAWEMNKGKWLVRIAVVDGGVDYTHDDLDPGDRSRVVQGYDTGNDDNDPMDDLSPSSDWAGHGTKVSGVIGAITNNNLQVAGINWHCRIVPVKVANSSGWGPFNWGAGSAFAWDIADGIEYAATWGAADIINMSFGGEGSTFWLPGTPLGEACWNAYYSHGVLLVAAMGNDDDDTVNYPAGYDYVQAVGATEYHDNQVTGLGWGSNYGPHIDLCAPGLYHYSTYRYQGEGYFSGTSCSTPMVSGVAGLILGESHDLGLGMTNDDMRHLMEASADKVPNMGGQDWHERYGYGRLNAEAALEYLQPPNWFQHRWTNGGIAEEVFDGQVVFKGPGGLPAGTYLARRWKVTHTVSLGARYFDTPLVWVREATSQGWSQANPNNEVPWVGVVSVTTTHATFETYVYDVYYNLGSPGWGDYGWYPCSPSDVVITYSVLGNPMWIEVRVKEDEERLGKGRAFTVLPAGGSGKYINYRWWKRVDRRQGNGIGMAPELTSESSGTAAGEWVYVPEWEGQQAISVDSPVSFSIKCEVTDSNGSTAFGVHSVVMDGEKGALLKANEEVIPNELRLLDFRPNPFNTVTTITFSMTKEETVRLTLYSITGQRVAKLIDSRVGPGRHTIEWDGQNDSGTSVAPGVYFCELEVGAEKKVKTVVLSR